MLLDAEKTFTGLPPAGFKFLSVASGAAYEVRDLYASSPDSFERFSCTLLDQDGFALSEAIEAIADIERRNNKISPEPAQQISSLLGIQSLNKSVRTMLRTPRLADAWGRFHFVYSVGLFDYLTPPVAKAVARKLYELLLPGGQLVIGNYHVNNPTKWYLEYWMDWVLYYRSENDLMELLGDDISADLSVFSEESGSQMFLHVKKR
jgi:SAM-dependent methyltransferase